MRVYLHIGIHKTGTTAIQHAFVVNREAFASDGVLYPTTGRPARPDISRGHHSLAWALTRPANNPDCWPELRRELDAAEQQTAVISSECLDLVTEDDHFSHMHSHLEHHEVRVVVYLRRQDEFLHANYCTNVLFYGETREFEEYVRNSRTVPDYRVLLEPWERAFGREALIVRPYERSQLIGGDIVRDFAARIGVALPPGFTAARNARMNRSYPRNVIEGARSLRAHGGKPEDFAALRELCARVYHDDQHTDADMLPPARRRALLDEFADSNQFVARTYLGREDGRLFDDLEIPDEGGWNGRYAGPLGDLSSSIRDIRDAFRELDGQPADQE